MDSFDNSESIDFWEDLSQHSSDSHRKQKPKHQTAKIFNPDSLSSPLEHSIYTLRRSKFIEEKQVRINEQETIRNYIKYSVSKINSRLEASLDKMRSNNSEFLYEIQNKSSDFQIIFRYLIDNEVLITQHRISNFKKRENKKKAEVKEPKPDKRRLDQELNLIKTKIYALRKAINVFSEESEKNNSEWVRSLSVLDELKARKEAERVVGVEEEVEPVLEKNNDFEDFQRKISQKKSDLLQELRDLESKCDNDKETIESLQLELKNAKKVIQAPILRTQVYSKLKDYIEDIEKDEKVSLSSSNLIVKNRRRVYSNKATSNLSLNLTVPKPTTAPTLSKFKFHSLKPKLSTSKTTQKPFSFTTNETTKPLNSHKRLK